MAELEDDLLAKIRSLPEPTSPLFAKLVRDLLPSTKDVRQRLESLLEQQAVERDSRFAVLYTLLTWHRRNSDFDDYCSLVTRYQSEFGDHPLYPTLEALCFSSTATNRAQLRIALEHAEAGIARTPKLPGVLHLFAEIVARLGELEDAAEEPGLLTRALKAVDAAIVIDDGKYAKYFATKARLLALKGEFQEAYVAVHRAIALEPSGSLQYTLRIADYNIVKAKIDLLRLHEKLKMAQEKSLEQLEEVRSNVVELLGLLAAIIAFLVTGSQVATRLTLEEAGRLMIIMGGTILMIFSAFSMIFFRGRVKWNRIAVFLFGILMVLIGSISIRSKLP